MSLHWNLLIDKENIAATSITTETAAQPGPNQIEVKLERFALTANNVTYAVLGKSFGMGMRTTGYWNFFPYDASHGLLPVWGIGEVCGSQHPDIQAGTSLYGYFPMASHVLLTLDRIGKFGFQDVSEHRGHLPAIYNQYVFTDGIPNFAQERDLWPVFRPLYVTGFMIADEIQRHNLFGASRVIVASASSKTAILFAHCLRQVNSNGRLIGLTSPRNRDFVTGLDLYSSVMTYDEVETMENTEPSAYVDMAGNGSVIKNVYTRLGDALKSGILVGKSHWDSPLDLTGLGGPKMNMFFAPEIIRQRTEEWGPELLQSKLYDAWESFLTRADSVTTVQVTEGPESAQDVYTQLVAGNVQPEKSHIIKLG